MPFVFCTRAACKLQPHDLRPTSDTVANTPYLPGKFAVIAAQIRRFYITNTAYLHSGLRPVARRPAVNLQPAACKWHGGRHGKCARVSRHGTGIPLPCLRGAARKACHAPETRRGCAVDAHPLSCFQIDLLRSFISPPLRCAFPRCAPSCR